MARGQFRNLIKEYRIRKGWTQMQLSTAVGYDSPQFISLIERGLSEAPYSLLGQFIVLLGIPEAKVKGILLRNFEDVLDFELNEGKRIAKNKSNSIKSLLGTA